MSGELDDQVDMLLHQSGHLSGSPVPTLQPQQQQRQQHYDTTPPPADYRDQQYQYHDQSPVNYGGGGYGQPEEYTGDDSQHGSPGRGSVVEGGSAEIPGYSRIQRWAARKQNRIKDLQLAKEIKEREDCPFQPNRNPVTRDLADLSPSQLYEDNKAWGYDEFIDRQAYSRRKKDEQKIYERKFWNHEARWTGEVTVPEPFELSDVIHNRKPKVASLRKTYDTVASGVRHHHGQDASEIEATAVPSGLFSCKTSQSIMEMSPERHHHHRNTRSVTSVQSETPPPMSARSAASGASGILVLSAEERGLSTPQLSNRTGGGRSYSARGATPPSSHRQRYGVSPATLTPHRQLPL